MWGWEERRGARGCGRAVLAGGASRYGAAGGADMEGRGVGKGMERRRRRAVYGVGRIGWWGAKNGGCLGKDKCLLTRSSQARLDMLQYVCLNYNKFVVPGNMQNTVERPRSPCCRRDLVHRLVLFLYNHLPAPLYCHLENIHMRQTEVLG